MSPTPRTPTPSFLVVKPFTLALCRVGLLSGCTSFAFYPFVVLTETLAKKHAASENTASFQKSPAGTVL
jgi:hypothetical protein